MLRSLQALLPPITSSTASHTNSLWVALVRAGAALHQPCTSQPCSSDSPSSSSRSLSALSQAARSPSSSVPKPPSFTARLMMQPSSSSTSQLLQWRCATKKAGGTARQKPDTPSRNLGTKLVHNEVIFPGQIVVRQRGTKYHPGYNVGMGKDHTLFSTMVGRVHFSKETVQHMGGKPRERTLVSVVPLNGDWSRDYKQLEEVAVQRKRAIKRQMLKSRAKEAALFFPLPQHAPRSIPLPASAPAAPAAGAASKGKGAQAKPQPSR